MMSRNPKRKETQAEFADALSSLRSGLRTSLGESLTDRRRGVGKLPTMARDTYSVREANNHFGSIVNAALAGIPQFITMKNIGAVVVLNAETVQALLAKTLPPRSLADMFPVNKDNPPVDRLVIANHPGKLKIAF